MKVVREKTKCKLCQKWISEGGFDKHLSTHYNPVGRNCNKWYKKYFKKDQGVCVCRLCDEEFHHEAYPAIASGDQYTRHLLKCHEIQN